VPSHTLRPLYPRVRISPLLYSSNRRLGEFDLPSGSYTEEEEEEIFWSWRISNPCSCTCPNFIPACMNCVCGCMFVACSTDTRLLWETGANKTVENRVSIMTLQTTVSVRNRELVCIAAGNALHESAPLPCAQAEWVVQPYRRQRCNLSDSEQGLALPHAALVTARETRRAGTHVLSIALLLQQCNER
jgi:hypothetical protein